MLSSECIYNNRQQRHDARPTLFSTLPDPYPLRGLSHTRTDGGCRVPVGVVLPAKCDKPRSPPRPPAQVAYLCAAVKDTACFDLISE
jgi:hypothetical protein